MVPTRILSGSRLDFAIRSTAERPKNQAPGLADPPLTRVNLRPSLGDSGAVRGGLRGSRSGLSLIDQGTCGQSRTAKRKDESRASRKRGDL